MCKMKIISGIISNFVAVKEANNYADTCVYH